MVGDSHAVSAQAPLRSPDGSSDASPSQFGILSEDDIAIEGMVIVFLEELALRGYSVPPGLTHVPEDMPAEELAAERRLFRTVLDLPRHRSVIDRCVPAVNTLVDIEPHAESRAAAPALYPAVEATVNTQIISSPSALLLSAWLSILISLQAEFEGSVEETDSGVDGELRLFKARRELGERLYLLVEGLLDSYLLSADAHHDSTESDALVQLLFHDMALRYDTLDRATCALDLILNLSSYLVIEAESLVSHPVVLATTEYVWRNGLYPSPEQSTNLSFRDSLIKVDRFSTPRILHAQTYLFSLAHAALTVYILMASSYGHFYAFNPFARNPNSAAGYQSTAPSFIHWVVWVVWIAGVFGWALEVLRSWRHRGIHSTLPLSPSTLLPLLHHSLVFVSLMLRIVQLLLFRRPSTLVLSTSLNMLAWSIPFLAASRILPQNLPPFGAPTHYQWFRLVDGQKSRDVGYRPPPKAVPESHRALRSIEEHLGGLIQFGNYFVIIGCLLLYSLSGDLDYSSVSALVVTPEGIANTSEKIVNVSHVFVRATSTPKVVSPLEARTTLAFTLVIGVVLAYFAGGRPSVTGRVSRPLLTGAASDLSGLHDLDGWDRYGREVAFRARRERIAATRFFLYLPRVSAPDLAELESVRSVPASDPDANTSVPELYDSVPSAFSVAPLTPPFNLLEPPMELVGFVCKQVGYDAYGSFIEEHARLYIWRASLCFVALWALGAKTVRVFYYNSE